MRIPNSGNPSVINNIIAMVPLDIETASTDPQLLSYSSPIKVYVNIENI